LKHCVNNIAPPLAALVSDEPTVQPLSINSKRFLPKEALYDGNGNVARADATHARRHLQPGANGSVRRSSPVR